MFLLKLIFEIGAVLGLALILRKFIGVPSSLSLLEDNRSIQRRLKGHWQWYSMVHIMLGVVFSISVFWLVYGIFLVVHSSGNYEGVLIVNHVALMVPSLIIGFLTSGLFSRTVYTEIFGMSETIFDRIAPQSKWVQWSQKAFGVVMLIMAIMLLNLQFKVFLKTDGENIYMGSFDRGVKTFAIDDIDRVIAINADNIDIILSSGEHIPTSYYSGNVNYFLDSISK